MSNSISKHTIRIGVAVAAILAGTTTALAGPDIDGPTCDGWTLHGLSTDTGVYVKGGGGQVFRISSTVFYYDPVNAPIVDNGGLGTGSGFAADSPILGLCIETVSGTTGQPTIKLDLNNNSFAADSGGLSTPAGDGKSSFSSNGDLGDASMNSYPNTATPQEITIRNAGAYDAAASFYLPNGGNWGGGGQPGFRGYKAATNVYKTFFDMQQMNLEFAAPSSTRVPDGKPELTPFAYATAGDVTVAIGGLGGTEAYAKRSLYIPPPAIAATLAGFEAPVDPPHVATNQAKGGQAIPLKFQVAVDGVPVTDLTLSDIDIDLLALDCSDLNPTMDAIEQFVTAGTTELINKGNGYYQLNWKTLKTKSVVCRQVNVTLHGEYTSNTLTANFRLNR